jgi:hypothetical protein
MCRAAGGGAHHAWMSGGVRAPRWRQQPPHSGVQDCWVLHGLLLRGRGLGQCRVQCLPQHSRLCGTREHLRQQSGHAKSCSVQHGHVGTFVGMRREPKHTCGHSALLEPLSLLPYLPQGQDGAGVCDHNPVQHSMDGAVTGRHSCHSSSLSVELVRGARGRALHTQGGAVDKRQMSGLSHYCSHITAAVLMVKCLRMVLGTATCYAPPALLHGTRVHASGAPPATTRCQVTAGPAAPS